jgi:hypothetical protein
MAAVMPIAMAIGSAISARRGSRSAGETERIASTPTAEERAAGAGASRAAGDLSGMGQTLYGQGQGALGQTSGYYQKLLGRGGKEAALAAVGPQMENISQLYGGVSRGLEGRNVRGGVRDLGIARAERDKAGQMSRLIHGVQPGAAAALTGIGKFQTATGVGATGRAGGIFSDLLGKGLQGRGLSLQGRLAGEQARGKTGGDIGALLFSLLSGMSGGGGGKSGGGAGAAGAGLPQLGGGKYQGLPVGAG